jgi:hypothetical protein
MRKTEITLLFIGVVFLVLFSVRSQRIFLSVGWAGLLLAYFTWLSRTYKEKRPLYARGGLLSYTEQPRGYKVVCIVLLGMGTFAVLAVFMSVWIPNIGISVP